MIKPGDTIYTFQGEALEELIVSHIVDKYVLAAFNENCSCHAWKVFCYPSREEAFQGMKEAMLVLRREYDL